jgi:predicted phage-related endonuclease
MKTHDLRQGTPEWHAHRATCFNASDAPAMLGCDPYRSRNDLLLQLHSGVSEEPDRFQQRRFDEGHEFEALARTHLAERLVGEELSPIAGSDDFGLPRPLGASFDGITLMDDPVWEHKRLNNELREALPHDGVDGPEKNNAADLPKRFRVQMEQQLMVSGATRVLFTASEWDANEQLVDARHCWYTSDPALRAELLGGWKQFAEDLAAFTPSAPAQKVEAAPVESLPAVSVRMDGALTVHSNLEAFGGALRAFVDKMPKKPSTDQEFADCDAACKALKKAEEALEGAQASALAQVSSVEQVTRVIADLKKLARDTRLASEKLIDARKKQIRIEEVQRGRDALGKHIANLNERLGRPYMPTVQEDFAGAISGKKNLDSVHAAIDTELARCKIVANEIADRIQVNLNYLREHAEDYKSLFHDTATVVLKAPDDLQALVRARIAEHQEQERKRREREEAAARERLEREQAAARQREEEQQRAQQQPAATQPPAAPSVAASPSTVVPLQRPAPAVTATPTLRLGVINERLAPLQLDAAGLKALGFEPAAVGASKLYHEADFPAMCDAVIALAQRVRDGELAAA